MSYRKQTLKLYEVREYNRTTGEVHTYEHVYTSSSYAIKASRKRIKTLEGDSYDPLELRVECTRINLDCAINKCVEDIKAINGELATSKKFENIARLYLRLAWLYDIMEQNARRIG